MAELSHVMLVYVEPPCYTCQMQLCCMARGLCRCVAMVVPCMFLSELRSLTCISEPMDAMFTVILFVSVSAAMHQVHGTMYQSVPGIW